MCETSEILIKRKSNEEIKILLDKEDYDRTSLYKWYYHSRGLITCLKRKRDYKLLHNFILGTNKRVCFKNGNKFDCRKENLFIDNFLSRRRKKYKEKLNNKIVGIYFDLKKQYYLSHIKFNKRQYSKTFFVKNFKNDNELAKQAAIEYRKTLISLSNDDLLKHFQDWETKLKFKRTYRKLTDKEFIEAGSLLPEVERLINIRVHKWIPNGMLSFGDFRQNVMIDFMKKYVKFKDKFGGHLEERDIFEKWFTRFVTFRLMNIRSKINNYTHSRISLDGCNDKSERAKGHIKNKEESQITILTTLPNTAPVEIDFDTKIKELDKLAEMKFNREEFDIYQKMKNDENFLCSKNNEIKQKLLEIIRENDLVLDN